MIQESDLGPIKRRGSQKARKVRELQRFLNRELAGISPKMASFIFNEISKGKSVEAAVSKAYTFFNLKGINQKFLEERVLEGYLISIGLLPVIEAVPEIIKRKIMLRAWSEDGINLSTRINLASKSIKKELTKSVRLALKEGKTFSKLTLDIRPLVSGRGPIKTDPLNSAVDKILRADTDLKYRAEVRKFKKQISKMSELNYPSSRLGRAYSNFIKATESRNAVRIEKAIDRAIRAKNHYVSQRIARTELVRANFEGFIIESDLDHDIVAYRWNKVSNHIDSDVCTFHSNANLYGMGPGIYPKDSFPRLPAFPNCRCFATEVFISDNPGKPDKSKANEGARKFIDALPEKEKREMLGKKGLESYKKTGRWKSNLKNYSGEENPKARLSKTDLKELLVIEELRK